FFPGGGDLRPVQATPATVYQAASLSKTLAAVASLWIVQHGQLTLDADVTNLQTSWKLPPGKQTAANPVTLRRLLGMTGGTNVHGFAGYAINCTSSSCPLPTLTQILNGTNPPANNAAIQVTVTPGTQWTYSGGGYEVVHSLLQDVSGGSSYASIVQNNILTPLNMTSSTVTIPLPNAQLAQAAAGFIAPNGQIANLWNTYPELAAAGLWTTPSDMARLLLEISVAYEGGKGAVLTQASAQAMMTQVDSSQYGLGGAVRNPGTNNVLFMKNGSNLGFTSWFLVYPQIGSGLVIMTNYDEDTNTPANWTNLFGSAASAAVTGLGWSNFPGLADQG
ncbi:MAG: serine hydrolase domain-containing protein, partial [Candidatus Acidiferrales bacterium]